MRQLLLFRASARPLISAVNLRTFHYKTGGLELRCGLNMASVGLENLCFFCHTLGRQGRSSRIFHKLVQGGPVSGERRKEGFRINLEVAMKTYMDSQ